MKTFLALPVTLTIGLCLVSLSTGIVPDNLQLTNSEMSFLNGVYKNLVQPVCPEPNRLVEESVGEASLMGEQGTFIPKPGGKANAIITVGTGNNAVTAIYKFIALQIMLANNKFPGSIRYKHVTVVATQRNPKIDKKLDALDHAITLLKELMGQGNYLIIQEQPGDTAADILAQIGLQLLTMVVLNDDGMIGTGIEGSNIEDRLRVGLEVIELIEKVFKAPVYAHDVSSGLGAMFRKRLIHASENCNSIGRVHPDQRPQGVVITPSFLNALLYINENTKGRFGQTPVDGKPISVAEVGKSNWNQDPTSEFQLFRKTVVAIRVDILHKYKTP